MNFASSTIMPLLARLIIAAAMLTSGWVNCFGQVHIRQEIADGLREMKIAVHENSAVEAETDIDAGNEATPETSKEHATPALQTPTVISDTTTTKGVNRIVWIMHSRWPALGGWGTFISWCAAVMQLVAGILILIGLYTRPAALCIAVVIGVAIYLVSAHIHGMFAMNPFDWPHDSHRFIQLFAGLGLTTLALGLVFSGAGGLSLDHRHAGKAIQQNKPVKNSST